MEVEPKRQKFGRFQPQDACSEKGDNFTRTSGFARTLKAVKMKALALKLCRVSHLYCFKGARDKPTPAFEQVHLNYSVILELRPQLRGGEKISVDKRGIC